MFALLIFVVGLCESWVVCLFVCVLVFCSGDGMVACVCLPCFSLLLGCVYRVVCVCLCVCDVLGDVMVVCVCLPCSSLLLGSVCRVLCDCVCL